MGRNTRGFRPQDYMNTDYNSDRSERESSESSSSYHTHVKKDSSVNESVSSLTSSSLVSESIITTKGGKKKKELKINIEELNSLIEDLRYYSDMKINNLHGDIKVKFGNLKKMVSMLYDTTSYDILVKRVKSYFDDLETIIPGTIGAYCIGCNHGKACSALCAGSMQQDNSYSVCKDTVILAELKNGRYNLTVLKSNEDSDSSESSSNYPSGYVFVPHKTLDEFNGFSNREKKMIEKLGITNIQLYGYDEEGKEHFKLDVNHIDSIKSRKLTKKYGKSSSEEYEYTWVIFLVFFIIFLLIAGFLLANKWRYGHL